MSTTAQESGLPVKIAKRAGKLLLGVFFWFMVLGLLVDMFGFAVAVLRWRSPDWDVGGFMVLCAPRSFFIQQRLWAAVLLAATAAIGWLYVFRRKYRFLWILITLWGIVTLALGVTGYGVAHPPPDAELIERFQGHEKAFERLAAMWREDATNPSLFLGAVEAQEEQNSQADQQQIPSERLEEYRSLARQIGVKSLSRSESMGLEAMLFVSQELELMGCLIEKGYAYVPEEPAPLVESLDEVPPQAKTPVYRRVRGNWYLFYIRSNFGG
jgi:hypothetical protein